MQLTSSHLESCVKVRTSAGVGTCFFRRVGPKGAFVSATHLFAGVRLGELVHFRRSDDWLAVTVSELNSHPHGDDVCAFTTDEVRWRANEAETRAPGLLPGDPVRFL